MADLDGSILVVHPDRKAHRVLQRILGAAGRTIVVVDGCEAADAALEDGMPAVVVMASAVRLSVGCDAIIEKVSAGGCAGCIIVHDDRSPVPPTLFDVGTLCHLVTSAMPVLAEELFATVQKLLRRDLFGIDKYLAWGAFLGETEITATDDRLRALGDLGTLCERMQIGRRQQAAVLLAADELVLNAVHHAPVDEDGNRYLRDLPRDATRDLAGRERPKLRFGCDGRWFAVSVRDAYGSVDAATLVRYVAKSLVRRGQVRTEGPGAGIGLAMTFTAVTQLVFDVEPGRVTEAIALVDVRPWSPTTLPLVASFHLFFAG
jgi:hypothetical protein